MTEEEKARKARQDASDQLNRIRSRWPDIHNAIGPLVQMREENHFAQRLERAFRGEED